MGSHHGEQSSADGTTYVLGYLKGGQRHTRGMTCDVSMLWWYDDCGIDGSGV